MKTMKKILSIAALALTGALMTSCGTDDDIIENAPQIANEQPVKKNNIVVVKTTVGLADNQTKALNIDYVNKKAVKTFAVGEQVAIRYWQEGNDDISFKAVSNPLTESDITDGGKSAKLTFTLVNPEKDQTVSFVYPAAMADEKGAWDPSKLHTQDGTLSSLAANLDLGTCDANMVNLQLPDVTLDNQFTILAITLKNSDGTKDITNTITSMTVREVKSDLSYTVNRTPADGPIYVAIQYILESDVEVIATDGTKYYTKSVSNKSYADGGFFQQGLRMTEVSSKPDNAINGLFTISSTKLAYFAKGNLRYKSGSWSFFGNQYDCNSTYNETDWDKFGWVGSTGSLALETPGKWGVSNSVVTSHYGTSLDILASDWGNVPGIGDGWRTLTSAEWDYLFNTRTVNGGTGAGHSYTLGQSVNDVLGVVLYPDNYTGAEYSGSNWSDFQAAGCVFLPAAGYRNSNYSEPSNALYNIEGNYWSSTTTNAGQANVVTFRSEYLKVQPNDRYNGSSVRLIYSAN